MHWVVTIVKVLFLKKTSVAPIVFTAQATSGGINIPTYSLSGSS